MEDNKELEEKILTEMKALLKHMPVGFWSHSIDNSDFEIKYNEENKVFEAVVDPQRLFNLLNERSQLTKQNIQLRNEIERLRIDAVLEEDLNNIQFGNFKELLNEDKG